MGKRILVIDDDRNILEALESVLSFEDYVVQTRLSPQDIDSDLESFNPDLVLLDINLGDFNGLQICRKLKSKPHTKSIPVIIMSADDTIHEAIQLFGANDIVIKPIDMDALLETIGKYLLAPVIQLRKT